MGGPRGAEYTVYTILRLSVIASLVVIAIGIMGVFYKIHIQGSPSGSDLVFYGMPVSDLMGMIFKGEPLGILGLSVITLILGVVLAIIAALVTSIRVKDNSLAIVSAILLLLLLLSASIGLIMRSRGSY